MEEKLRRFSGSLEILIFLVASMPGFYLSWVVLQEPWVLFRLARVALSIPTNTIETYTSAAAAYRVEHLGETLFDTALLMISSWPVEWLALVPFGTWITIFMYYALALKIGNSRGLALIMVLYAGWYYPRLVSQYGIQTYAWTNGLFFGFLWLFWEWLEKRRAIYSLLIMLVFIITFLFYQTTPLWIILALLAGNGLLYLRRRYTQSGLPVSWSLPLFCIVLYFSFDTVFYDNFFQQVVSEAAETSLLENLLSKVVGPLWSPQNTFLPPYHQMVSNPRFAVLSTLLSFIIFVIPVAAWSVVKLTIAWRKKSIFPLVMDRRDIFCWSLVFVTLGHTLGYSGYGAISLRLVPLVFPLLMLIIPSSLNLPHARTITRVLLLALMVVAISGFLCYARGLRSDPAPSQVGLVPLLLPDSSRILADANVFGAINLMAGKSQKGYDFVWPDAESYAALVTGEAMGDLDYAVLDKYHKPLITTGWVFLEPWAKYLPYIEQNPTLSKVYDSHYLSVFQDASETLPSDRADLASLKLDQPSFMAGFIRLFLTLVVVLIVPGLAVVMVLRDLDVCNIEHPYSLLFLSMVLSIGVVIAVGYLVCFTSLGLKQYVPILFLTELTLFGADIAIRRLKHKPLKISSVRYLSFFVIIVLWACFSALIAVSRPASRSEFTEFFVTQSAADMEPRINVRNQTSREQAYMLYSYVGDPEAQMMARFTLQPGKMYWQEIGYLLTPGESLALELWNQGGKLSLYLR